MKHYRYFFGFTIGYDYPTSFGVITLPMHIPVILDVMTED